MSKKAFYGYWSGENIVVFLSMDKQQLEKKIRITGHQIAAYRAIHERLAESSRHIAMLGAYGAPITKLDQLVGASLNQCTIHITTRLQNMARYEEELSKIPTEPYSPKY